MEQLYRQERKSRREIEEQKIKEREQYSRLHLRNENHKTPSRQYERGKQIVVKILGDPMNLQTFKTPLRSSGIHNKIQNDWKNNMTNERKPNYHNLSKNSSSPKISSPSPNRNSGRSSK